MAKAMDKPNAAFGTLRNMLGQCRNRLAASLPKHMNADKLIHVALQAVSTTPELLDCDLVSIVRCTMYCATLGLYPDSIGGQAALVPFNGRCQLIVGYRGYVELMYRNPRVENVSAHVVYENDQFDYAYGLEETMIHRPFRGADRGEKTAAYAVVHIVGGGKHFEVMEAHDILYVKSTAPGARKPSSPWNHPVHEARMWAKTALRRAAMLSPMSTELQRAVAVDEAADAGLDQVLDLPPELEPPAGNVLGPHEPAPGLRDLLDAAQRKRDETDPVLRRPGGRAAADHESPHATFAAGMAKDIQTSMQAGMARREGPLLDTEADAAVEPPADVQPSTRQVRTARQDRQDIVATPAPPDGLEGPPADPAEGPAQVPTAVPKSSTQPHRRRTPRLPAGFTEFPEPKPPDDTEPKPPPGTDLSNTYLCNCTMCVKRWRRKLTEAPGNCPDCGAPGTHPGRVG